MYTYESIYHTPTQPFKTIIMQQRFLSLPLAGISISSVCFRYYKDQYYSFIIIVIVIVIAAVAVVAYLFNGAFSK